MANEDGVPREFFHLIYKSGASELPWDIARAQPEVERLVAAGELRGRVLDVGCGPGDNAIAVARGGASVLAIDHVPAAVELARKRARAAGVPIELAVADALDLGALGRRFDAALDSGTFHTLSDANRPRYAASLAAVLEPGAALHLLCFSDAEPGTAGPRRVTEAELRAAFDAPRFHVASVERARFATRNPTGGAAALRARVVRLG
ncbi:MAG TPA: class I SAM-dependent methyltransferase [Minicystis sp.]|nr:class I SAM-dependent methyltransferase [Minicystis sp.]